MSNNNKELEQLSYDDALLEFFHVCQQYGARRVLEDFRRQFPDMHKELVVQIARQGPLEKVAALFLPKPDSDSK